MNELQPGWYAASNSTSELAHLVPERQYLTQTGPEAFCGARIDPEVERPHWHRCVRCVRKVERLQTMVEAAPPAPITKQYTLVVTRPEGDEIDDPFIDMLIRKFRSNRRIEIAVVDATPSTKKGKP